MRATTQGRRAEDDDAFWADPPGVWWHWPSVDVGTGAPEERWLVRPPCGHHFMLAHGTPHHVVEQHDDGMITVRPNPPAEPSNSNSILCHCGWHGYIDHGVWRSV